MKVMAILPEFLPIEEISKTVKQILPEVEIRTDTEFEKNDGEVLIVTTFTTVGKDLIDRLPNLKFVQVASTGYDNVDSHYLGDKGIIFSNIPVANKESVAEHVIAMVLSFLKNLRFFDEEIRKGQWPVLTNSTELEGKVFGIVGMGAIGIKLAERLIPFGPGIVYSDVRKLPEDVEERYGLTFMELTELIETSDIISLHVPLTKSTNKLLSHNEFSKMKDGAIVINTSRGEVIDEEALISAIKTKGIKAGIDVYVKEPPNFSSDLFKLDNVIFSPHIAGVTMESQQRFITETISNVLRFTQGLDPLYKVR